MSHNFFNRQSTQAAGDSRVAKNESVIIENEHILINISMLYHISFNDKRFVQTMVETFLRYMPETVAKLEQGLNNNDWESVYRAAHSAKSSLSVIKIEEMLGWVVQVEVNAKNGTNLDAIPDLVEKIKQKFNFAEALLKQRFGANDTLQ